MAATFDELVSERQFYEVTYSLVILASLFTIIRTGIQIWKKKAMQPQDYLLYSAYVCFLAMSISYLAIIPTIYRIGRVNNGLMLPSQAFVVGIVQEASDRSASGLCATLVGGLHILLDNRSHLLCELTAVNDDGQSLAGCVASYFTSCPDFAVMMQTGECSGPRSLRGQLASLYSSYAVDILSGFMSMHKLASSINLANGGSHASTHPTRLESPGSKGSKDSHHCALRVRLHLHRIRNLASCADWPTGWRPTRPQSHVARPLDRRRDFHRHMHWLLALLRHLVSEHRSLSGLL